MIPSSLQIYYYYVFTAKIFMTSQDWWLYKSCPVERYSCILKYKKCHYIICSVTVIRHILTPIELRSYGLLSQKNSKLHVFPHFFYTKTTSRSEYFPFWIVTLCRLTLRISPYLQRASSKNLFGGNDDLTIPSVDITLFITTDLDYRLDEIFDVQNIKQIRRRPKSLLKQSSNF